jgi:hypothetical protein
MFRKCLQVVSRGSSTSKATSWGNWPLWSHLKVCRAPSCSQTTQPNLQQTFARNTPLQKDSIKAKAITHAIGMMIAVDLRPYSIVENEGFWELLKIWEPWYPIISRKELTQTVVPEIFSDIKQKLKLSLEGSKVGWTLPWTSEYMTVVNRSLGCRKRWALLEVEELSDSADTYNIRKAVSASKYGLYIDNLKYHKSAYCRIIILFLFFKIKLRLVCQKWISKSKFHIGVSDNASNVTLALNSDTDRRGTRLSSCLSNVWARGVQWTMLMMMKTSSHH